MTKEVIIIFLVVLVVYLYYQQNNQPKLASNSQELQDLKQQVQHYQTLYQKRIAKDLGGENIIKQKDQNLANLQNQKELLTQKIKDQDTALINLAKQKIKGQKQVEQLLNNLETS
jgi:hypothetical protein